MELRRRDIQQIAGRASTGRLGQDLDLLELGFYREIAVIEHAVARDAVVEQAHGELEIGLLGAHIGGGKDATVKASAVLLPRALYPRPGPLAALLAARHP